MSTFGRNDGAAERRITRAAVWRLRRGEVIWDSELHGFGVEATNEGKHYFLTSGIGGERRRYLIGRHGEPWSPETARAEAWRLKAELMRAADTGGKRQGRRLTAAQVESLKPGEIAWDGDVKGFGVRCQRVSKVYFLKARVGGRQRWVTIGTHGSEWSPESARREAARLRGEIASDGVIASEEATRRQMTLAELCDLYLKQGCEGKRASTVATDRGRIERHIKPLLGSRRVHSLSPADIERFVAEVTEGKSAADIRTGPRGRAIVTGGAGTAARTLGLLGGVFSFAVERGLCKENPVRGARVDSQARQVRPPSAAELERLGGAIAALAQGGADAGAVAALRLLVLTGCRSTELLALTWNDVDLEGGSLRLPDAHWGHRFVALPVPALRFLASLGPGPGNHLMLPGQTVAGRLPALARVWRETRRFAGLDRLRLLDLANCFPLLGCDALERFLAAEPLERAHEAPSAMPEDLAGESAEAARPVIAVCHGTGPTADLAAWRAAADGPSATATTRVEEDVSAAT